MFHLESTNKHCNFIIVISSLMEKELSNSKENMRIIWGILPQKLTIGSNVFALFFKEINYDGSFHV